EVVLLSFLVPRPCRIRFTENLSPIIRRLPISVCIVSRRLPYVPVALRGRLGRARVEKPRMLIRRMVGHQVHNKLHVTLLHFLDEVIDISEVTVAWINIFVICNIITHVCLWTLID
ncbi:hypothetical protein BU23DRAFT_630803, partial [Bimuria novae-zelandiae CBS 107.79]